MMTLCIAADAADWPQFLGPNRNGISTETGLLDTFPAAGPKVVWRVPGGVGMSGLAVRRDRLVTMVQRAGKQFVVAIRTGSGKRLWAVAVAPAYRNSMGDGPRGTPTISGDSVFVFTGQGILVSLKLADGAVNWSHDTLKELGGRPAEYGMACSPLVVGNLVVVTAGANRGTVVAYQHKTGKLAWTSGRGTAGYSSPALLAVGRREQIVAFTGTAAVGLEPKSGRLFWRFPYRTNYDCNIATPLAVGGKVFISSGEDHGSALLSLTPAGKRFSVKTVWTSHGRGSVMRNEWQTSILLGGSLYGMDNIGGAGPITNLNCIDAATGKLRWRKKRFGKGNLIAADGKLFIITMRGALVLVRVNPRRFEELARSRPLVGSTRQSPALSNGRLYLRDGKEIVCVDVRKP